MVNLYYKCGVSILVHDINLACLRHFPWLQNKCCMHVNVQQLIETTLTRLLKDAKYFCWFYINCLHF